MWWSRTHAREVVESSSTGHPDSSGRVAKRLRSSKLCGLCYSHHGVDNAIHRAATMNSPICVSALLQSGCDPNSEDECGRTPLVCAIQANAAPKVADLLREAGASLDGRPRSVSAVGATVMLVTERSANPSSHLNPNQLGGAGIQTVQAVTTASADQVFLSPMQAWVSLHHTVCVKLGRSPPPLHAAVSVGATRWVRYLLHYKASPNVFFKDVTGEHVSGYPLHAATERPECLHLLIRHGAVCRMPVPAGCESLLERATNQCCVRPESTNAVAVLKSLVEDYDIYRPSDEYQPAFTASRTNRAVRVLEGLLEWGGVEQATHQDASGRTPAHAASICNADQALRALLARKAPSSFGPDDMGFLPIHHAVKNNSINALRELLTAGADPNSCVSRTGLSTPLSPALNSPGLAAAPPLDTALHMAVRQDCVEATKLLLAHGADLSVWTSGENFSPFSSDEEIFDPGLPPLLTALFCRSDNCFDLIYGWKTQDGTGASSTTVMAKRAWLNREFERLPNASGTRIMMVDRNQSLARQMRYALNRQERERLAGCKLDVQFEGEQGSGDGVNREWEALLALELCSNEERTFECAPGGHFHPCPGKPSARELDNFHIAGLLAGMALIQGHSLPMALSSAVLKYTLCKTPESVCTRDAATSVDPNCRGIIPSDLSSTDPALWDHVSRLLDDPADGSESSGVDTPGPGGVSLSDVVPEMGGSFDSFALPLTPETRRRSLSLSDDEIEGLDMRFVDGQQVRGAYTEVELMPQGAKTKVTPENKKQYVELLAKRRLVDSCASQLKAFRDGFRVFCPGYLCEQMAKVIEADDLHALLFGEPQIDIADWRDNTTYWGGLKESSRIVAWFWEAMGRMKQQDLRNLLAFVHGSQQVPLGGFSKLRGFNGGTKKFNIRCQLDASADHLPTAQTCFNTLIVPAYQSCAELEKKLRQALSLNQGFDEGLFEEY